jgi:hypothetical protein
LLGVNGVRSFGSLACLVALMALVLLPTLAGVHNDTIGVSPMSQPVQFANLAVACAPGAKPEACASQADGTWVYLSEVHSVDAGNGSGDLLGQPRLWASGRTATFSVNTEGTNLVTCRVTGCGGLQVSNGIMIFNAGIAEPQPAITVAPTITHIGAGIGTHSYQIIIVVADPSGGMSAASPASNTLRNMPALFALGQADYISFYTSTGSARPKAPVYLIYNSYDGGPYTFVTTVNALPGSTAESNDYGQRPATGRGWPTTISGRRFTGQREHFWSYVTAVVDSNHLQLNDAVPVSLTGATAQPDDSYAVYLTEQIAESRGGGAVLFGAHSYNVWRLLYWNGSTWQSSVAANSQLMFPTHIPVEQSNISFFGTRDQTTIDTGPQSNVYGSLFGYAIERKRPWNLPYYATSKINQGDSVVQLSTPSQSSDFATGDDLWIFAGSFFSSACRASGGTPGSNCHWGESNSIVNINSSTGQLFLKYRANKTYYADAQSNPFGVVDMKPATAASNVGTHTLHNVSVHDLTVNSYDPLCFDGVTYNESIYKVRMPLGSSSGFRYGGLDRNYSVHDNQLVIGDESGNFHAEEEMDLDADVTFLNNELTFLVANGIQGSYLAYGIGLTEGTSDVRIIGNRISNGYIRSEVDVNSVLIQANNFFNSSILLGCYTSEGCNVSSFSGTGSFVQPNNWNVLSNTFQSAVYPNDDVVLESKNVVAGQVIAGNVISMGPNSKIRTCIRVSSGAVVGNTCCTKDTTFAFDIGVEVHPLLLGVESIRPMPISVLGNNINHLGNGNGVYIDDPGGSWGGYVNVTGNTEDINKGTGDTVASTAHTPNVNFMGEQIYAPTGYNPSTLADIHFAPAVGLTTSSSRFPDAIRLSHDRPQERCGSIIR